MEPSVLPPFLEGGLKLFQCWQKGGTCTFWNFRENWVKIGEWVLPGGSWFWGFSESNFQLLMKMMMMGLVKKGWDQCFRMGLIAWRTQWWIFGKWFMKALKKKHSFHNSHIYIYRSQTFWSFMKFYLVHIVKICSPVFKKKYLCFYSSVYA